MEDVWALGLTLPPFIPLWAGTVWVEIPAHLAYWTSISAIPLHAYGLAGYHFCHVSP